MSGIDCFLSEQCAGKGQRGFVEQRMRLAPLEFGIGCCPQGHGIGAEVWEDDMDMGHRACYKQVEECEEGLLCR